MVSCNIIHAVMNKISRMMNQKLRWEGPYEGPLPGKAFSACSLRLKRVKGGLLWFPPREGIKRSKTALHAKSSPHVRELFGGSELQYEGRNNAVAIT